MSSPRPCTTERARSRAHVAWVLAAAGLAADARSWAAEEREAIVTLEAMSAVRPDQVPAALPLRFALFSDGAVYVGGTSRFLSGRLGKDEVSGMERRLADVRKLSGLSSIVSFGPGPSSYKLGLRKGKPLDIVVQGDPKGASPALAPLARLLADLLHFDHVSLAPYDAASYALRVREGKLVGGCRPWALPVSLTEALSAPVALPAAAVAVADWATGANPASVCAADKTYVVTLKPLAPGERP